MMSPSPWSTKSRVTSLSTATPRNGPKGFGSPSPRISARKVAETRLSRAWTIVWFNWTGIARLLSRISSELEGSGRVGGGTGAGHRRRGGAFGPGRVGHPVLRGQGAGQLDPHGRGAAPVPARRPPAAGLHPGGAAGRPVPGGDRRCPRPASARRRPDRLGGAPAVGRLAPAARRAHRAAHRSAGPARPLHRLRLPLARTVPAPQPR